VTSQQNGYFSTILYRVSLKIQFFHLRSHMEPVQR